LYFQTCIFKNLKIVLTRKLLVVHLFGLFSNQLVICFW